MVLSKLVTLSALAGVAMASSAKMDSRTFGKVLENAKGATIVAHIKKMYSYDSKDLTDGVTIGTADAKDVIVTDVELDSEKLDAENLTEKDDHSDWEKKDVKKRQGDKELVEKLSLDLAELPYFLVFKNGVEVGKLPVKDDSTTPENVQTFLASHGVKTSNSKEITELAPLVEKFVAKPSEDMLDELDKEVRKLDLNEAKEALAGAYMKVMKQTIKKGVSYIDTELVRVSELLKSDAVTAVKKKEMELKVQALAIFQAAKEPKKAEL